MCCSPALTRGLGMGSVPWGWKSAQCKGKGLPVSPCRQPCLFTGLPLVPGP